MALEIKNVSRTFEGSMKETLKDISLSVEQGEFICVVGPSGCGKSTLLNIIAGLDFPTDGEIFLDEKKIEESGQGHIQSLRIKTPSIDEIVGQLSGGNQQKVVIGKWINNDADIYIFDEPTRGIDVGAKVEVYNVMNSLVKAGKCVIMISSEMPEILGMSDRVVVMRGGRVMATVERDSKHFNQEDIMKAAWGGSLDD